MDGMACAGWLRVQPVARCVGVLAASTLWNQLQPATARVLDLHRLVTPVPPPSPCPQTTNLLLQCGEEALRTDASNIRSLAPLK